MRLHGAYSKEEAKSYDSDREVEPLWHIENAYVAELLRRNDALSILDIPVGTGRFFDLYTSRQVTGVDLSTAMLEEAHRRIGDSKTNITLTEASVTSLPYRKGQFDLVICWRLLHLLPADMLDTVFDELQRVCVGTLCVQCYVPATWWVRFSAKTLRRLRRLQLVFNSRGALTPWSHIQTWIHPLELILASAQRAGWGEPIHMKQLGIYEGTRVLAIEWKFT